VLDQFTFRKDRKAILEKFKTWSTSTGVIKSEMSDVFPKNIAPDFLSNSIPILHGQRCGYFIEMKEEPMRSVLTEDQSPGEIWATFVNTRGSVEGESVMMGLCLRFTLGW
jgi:protein gp37